MGHFTVHEDVYICVTMDFHYTFLCKSYWNCAAIVLTSDSILYSCVGYDFEWEIIALSNGSLSFYEDLLEIWFLAARWGRIVVRATFPPFKFSSIVFCRIQILPIYFIYTPRSSKNGQLELSGI